MQMNVSYIGDYEPYYASAGAAGADLRSNVNCIIDAGHYEAVPTGVTIALPEGYEAQVRPRSGWAKSHGVTVLNAPGTIDADYRGEIVVLLINHGAESVEIKRGQRIAQLVAAPVVRVNFVRVEALPPAMRGDAGFGSTGTT